MNDLTTYMDSLKKIACIVKLNMKSRFKMI